MPSHANQLALILCLMSLWLCLSGWHRLLHVMRHGLIQKAEWSLRWDPTSWIGSIATVDPGAYVFTKNHVPNICMHAIDQPLCNLILLLVLSFYDEKRATGPGMSVLTSWKKLSGWNSRSYQKWPNVLRCFNFNCNIKDLFGEHSCYFVSSSLYLPSGLFTQECDMLTPEGRKVPLRGRGMKKQDSFTFTNSQSTQGNKPAKVFKKHWSIFFLAFWFLNHKVSYQYAQHCCRKPKLNQLTPWRHR